MTTGRRVLVIAYTFPPMPTVGANRWDAMARHLRLLGHEVTIVSTSTFGQRRDPAEERHVRRASDLTANPWLRRALGRGPIPPPSDAAGAHRQGAPVETPLPEFLRQIFVPDLYITSWLPQAFRLAREVASEQQIECIITTSPYESVHLLGLLLRRRDLAWVADFRDGWLFEPHRPPFRTIVQQRLDGWLERQVAAHADAVVAATEPIADDFRRRLGIDASHIANGFDPLSYTSIPSVALSHVAPGAITLVHTGKLAGVARRDPRGLLLALAKLRETEPALASRLRLVLAGRLDTEETRLIAESGVHEMVTMIGELSHAESIALQREADVLVLVTSVDGAEATGKLFEYLSSGRPILALAGSTVARIVSETQSGVTIAPDDVGSIYEQLKRTAAGELPAYAPRALEQYQYPAPARRMSDEIERAVLLHSQRRANSGKAGAATPEPRP